VKLLLIGYLPPPYFGPSVTYQALMHSEFARRFEVTFLDIGVTKDIKELEHVRLRKLLRMLKFLCVEAWYLVTRRFDFCCCPISVNRNAFLKDAVLLGIARWCGVPTVLYAHGNNIPDFYARSSPWVQQLIERTIRRAAAAIVFGECLRFNFDRWLPAERIFPVPGGIEPLPHPPSRRRHNGVTVLYLGALVREKGVFVLLEAARRCPDVRFVFAGNWYKADEEAEAKRLAGKNVEFIGPVAGEAKAQALADADLLAFPTFYYYETMGLVLLEAMQAGLPVIATRRASIPEIVRDGVNGLLVEEQNAADLAGKILRLAKDPAFREQMGRANRRCFAEFYTHEQYGRRMIDVFERLAAHCAQ
jgi:glycosyltransferase involved in cell wall biosynthesis